MFYIGQKVVCIYNFRNDYAGDCAVLPAKGGVYTVRGIVQWKQEHVVNLDTVGLYLEEIVRQPIKHVAGFGERTWVSIGFRPLIEKKTDISIFQEMLMPKKVTEDV